MELKQKTDKELQELLEAKRRAIRVFRFDIAGSKIKNVKKGRNTRKEIARILTELNARLKHSR